MSSRNTRVGLLSVAALALLVAAYWYWSPHLALRSMKAAAEAGDADAFNQHLDYAKLRESLKGQFGARMADAIGSRPGESEMARAGSALGTMLGLALVDRMIDAMVRPEMMMKAMINAKLQNPAEKSNEPRSDGSRSGSKAVRWSIERKSTDRVVAYGSDGSVNTSKVKSQVGFVFDREGFARWKLTEIRLPIQQ